MGIPRFAAWLTKKFPPMVRRDAPANVHGLYIDMNGIIHPCCHSEEDPSVAKRTEAEKIEQVCLAVGNLVETAKPTHVLFLAMDGVAPRAKMNQQRARRYMSAVPRYGVVTPAAGADAAATAAAIAALTGGGAEGGGGGGGAKKRGGGGGLGLAPRENDFTEEEKSLARNDMSDAEKGLEMGIYGATCLSPTAATTTAVSTLATAGSGGEDPSRFDSNCISPGTVFMRRCSDRLKNFVAEKLQTDPLWHGLSVVVSDTNTPGEGEHKIIDFIRTQIGYGSAWAGMGSHVIHGNDADLILLCLGLHVPRVVICRENYRTGTHSPTSAAASPAAGVLSPTSADDGLSPLAEDLAALSPLGEGTAVPPALRINSTINDTNKGDDDSAASDGSASASDTEEAEGAASKKETKNKKKGATKAATVLSDDASTTDNNATNSKATPAGNANKKSGGGRRGGGRSGGGGGGRWKGRWQAAPKPRFEWYDIDVLGGCLVTELYDVSRRASAVLNAVPDYQTYTENSRKRLVVGPGGVGQVVSASSSSSRRKKDANNNSKQSKGESNADPPMDTAAAIANNHATFASRCHVPTDPATGYVRCHPATMPCNHRLVDDFITLATLMGNDFMPRLPSCFCGDSAMDNIVEVYVRTVLPFGFLSNPLTNDLDLKQLHRFFHGYAIVETTLFRQQCIKAGLLTPDEAMSLSKESLGGSSNGGEVRLPSPIDEKWRSLYYNSTTIGTPAFSTNNTNNSNTDGWGRGRAEAVAEGVQKACASYVEGIRFVLRYYSTTSRTTSWSWYFPFHHSPFAADLANFLEPFVKQTAKRPEEALPPPKLEVEAPLPFPQLMAILPPTSASLLPSAVAAVMRDPPQSLAASTFPSEWRVDFTAADEQEHLAAVLLPFADFKVLIETAEGCKGTFTEEERSRNVNVSEQCVLIRSTKEGGGSAAAGAQAEEEEAGRKMIEDRVRGGIAFKKTFAPSVLEFSYVDIPSPFLNKNKTYTATFKPIDALMGTGAGADGVANGASATSTAVASPTSARDEKNAKMYKRRQDQNNRTDVAGYRYWPKNFLAPSEKGWFMSLGDFHMSAGVIAAFTGFVFTLVGGSTTSAAAAPCCLSLLCAATANAVVTLFIFGLGSAMLCALGVGVSSPRKDSGIKRNNTRDAYVDWVCTKCLSLNFSRNEKCYTCMAPCDEAAYSWALFSNKHAQIPPHLEPNHAPYLVDVKVRFPKAGGGAADATPPPPPPPPAAEKEAAAVVVSAAPSPNRGSAAAAAAAVPALSVADTEDAAATAAATAIAAAALSLAASEFSTDATPTRARLGAADVMVSGIIDAALSTAATHGSGDGSEKKKEKEGDEGKEEEEGKCDML